jgi:hypothetical protein
MSNSPRATQRQGRAAARVKFGGRIRRSATIAAALISTISGALGAQVVRGTISDSASHLPISGAVITLVDSAGAILGRNISDERGQYRVAYVRTARSLNVVRIGFQHRELPVGALANLDSAVDVVMTPFNASLGAVRVMDQQTCPRRADRAAALAFWDQARAGLLNTVVARANNTMAVDRLYFQRAFNGRKESVSRFIVSRDTSHSATSFEAAHAARDFVRDGFKGDTGVMGLVFGPDADVLLDDAFAHGYCFHLAVPQKSRPNQVGLAFSPANFRRGRVDIDGTLWIDTSARVLRDVEYRYVGLDPLTDKFRPGGVISFATSANGIAFIDRWHLRLYSNTVDGEHAFNCGQACSWYYYAVENGAEVSHVSWPDGRRWDGSLGTVRIRARTTDGKPAAGAEVQLSDTHYRGTADSTGTIVIRDLLPGKYSVRIRDERIAELGFLLPTSVTFTAVRDSVVQLTVEAETVEEYLTRQCRRSVDWVLRDSTYIFGRVMDEDGKPVGGVRVSFALKQINGEWVFGKEIYKTDTDGLFQDCKSTFTHNRTVLVRVGRWGERYVEVEHVVASSLSVVKVVLDSRR